MQQQQQLSIYPDGIYHGHSSDRDELTRLYGLSWEAGQYVCVSGPSGSGKGVLVETQPWNTPFVCSGKFDSQQIAFSALQSCLNRLLQQWASTQGGTSEIQDFLESRDQDEGLLRRFLPSLYSWSAMKTTSKNDDPVENRRESFLELSASLPFEADKQSSSIHMSTPATNDSTNFRFEQLRTVIYKLLKAFLQSSQDPDEETAPSPPPSRHDNNKLHHQTSTKTMLATAKTHSTRVFFGSRRRSNEADNFKPPHTVTTPRYKKKRRSKPRSLVILLRELQHADVASLRLIQFLVQENLPGLFVVATYRPEQVNETLKTHLEKLQKSLYSQDRVHTIELLPLPLDQVNQRFAQVTHNQPDETLPLVQVIHEKTGGNPFSVQQFVQLLQQEGYLKYDFSSLKWTWVKADEIRQAMAIVSTQVACLVSQKMRTLENDLQETLKVCSCLGSQVPVNIVHAYFARNCNSEAAHQAMLECIEEMLEQLVQLNILKRPHMSSVYFWAHNQLQQAAWNLMESVDQDNLRLAIGKSIMEMVPHVGGLAQEFLVYIAAGQLNQVPVLLLSDNSTDTIRIDLATLNLLAAKLSIRKSAIYPAIDFLKTGISLMTVGKKYSLLRISPKLATLNDTHHCNSPRTTNRRSLLRDQTNQDPSPRPRQRSPRRTKSYDDQPLRPNRAGQRQSRTKSDGATITSPSEPKRSLSGDSTMKNAENFWSSNYDLCLELCNNLLETQYKVGHYDEARRVIDDVLEHAETMDDKFRAQACLLDITVNSNKRDYEKATALCLAFLKQYGIVIAAKPDAIHLAVERRRLKKALINGKVAELLSKIHFARHLVPIPQIQKKFKAGSFEALLDLPLMTDPRALNISVFLGKLANFAGLSQKNNLCMMAALRSFQLSAKHGISTHTGLAMAMYAFALRQMEKYDESYRYAKKSGDLLQRLGTNCGDNYAKILCIIHSSMIPLKKPLQDSLGSFLECYRIGMMTGDVEYAMKGATNYGYNYLFVGQPLRHLRTEMQSYGLESRQFGLALSIQTSFPMMQQVVLNLQFKSKNPTTLKGEALDLQAVRKTMEGDVYSKTLLRDVCTLRLMLSYIYRDFTTAKTILEELDAFKTYNPSIALSYLRQVFTGLCSFTLSRDESIRRKRRAKYYAVGKSCVEYFRKALESGAVNAFPLYKLLLAERSHTKRAYDEAIRVCSRSGLVNFGALANESAALYFFSVDDEDWAMHYMDKAVGLYEEWGAMAKVQALKERYTKLESGIYNESRRPEGTTTLGMKGYFRKSMVLEKLSGVQFKSNLDLFNSERKDDSHRANEEELSIGQLSINSFTEEKPKRKSSLGSLTGFVGTNVFGRRAARDNEKEKRESNCTLDTINTFAF